MALEQLQPSKRSSQADPEDVSPKVVSYPWRTEDGDVVAWSRRTCELTKQLTSLDGLSLEALDIDTSNTGVGDAPQEGRSCASTEALLRQQDGGGSWRNHCAQVPVPENAVGNDPHGHCTRKLLEGFTGKAQKLQRSGAGLAPLDLSVVPEESRVSLEDVVVTVSLNDPKGRKEQEYDVLASQTLEDLRDAFYFVGDFMYDGPTRLESACMFVDGVFYVDNRQASALDYSVELIEWLKTLDFPLREQKSRPMSTRICDLERIPFGEPCCFIRQGDIEHQMYFTGARLLNPRVDCPVREGYWE